MVGVPGRSKGCATCRKRKIGCGLERPECAQCIKSKRICGGYQRDRIFINHTGTAGEDRDPSLAFNVVKTSVVAVQKTAPYDGVGQMNLPKHKSSLKPNGTFHGSILQDICPLALFRQQLIGAFLSYHMLEQQRGVTVKETWFTLLSQLPIPTIALQRSILAMCAARIGRIHNDEALIQKSLRLYTEGLRELQKALYDPNLMYSNQTLGACMALASYELLECPGGTKYAYASHRSGCARLIQLRGPNAHVSGLGHQMFIAFRLQTIMSGLEYHQPTYLAEEPWLKIPWKYNPKSRFDELLDIVSEAPAIFRRADDFQMLDPVKRPSAACAVIRDCWRVDETLHTFYREFSAAATGPLYWEEPSKKSFVHDIDDVFLFPKAYHFPDIDTGKTLVFYWATLTMLWTGMFRLYHLVAALEQAGVSTPEIAELPPLKQKANFIAPARNVLQSVEYMLEDRLLGLGPLSIVAPVSIVVETIRDFPQYAHEVTWGDEVLVEVKERGLQILGCTGRSWYSEVET